MTMTKFSRINKQREEITMRVLEDMEKGGNEWKKPWVEASPLPPHNPVSGTQYSGRKANLGNARRRHRGAYYSSNTK